MLALRLSAANGWNVTAHILRELGAAWLSPTVVLSFGSAGLFLLAGVVDPAGIAAASVSDWAVIGCTCLVQLAALAAFCFAMGRTVRGWLWAAAPALIAAGDSHSIALGSSRFGENYSRAAALLLPAVVVCAFAVFGSRRESPKLHRLAWGSAALLLVGWCIVQVVGIRIGLGGSLLRALFTFLPESVRLIIHLTYPLGVIATAGPPCLLWLGAWLMERVGRASAIPVAE